MKNLFNQLKEIEEDFAVTTSAFGQLPTPVVDATGIKVSTKPEKDKEEVEKEKEL
jgi:hypothetical protein